MTDEDFELIYAEIKCLIDALEAISLNQCYCGGIASQVLERLDDA